MLLEEFWAQFYAMSPQQLVVSSTALHQFFVQRETFYLLEDNLLPESNKFNWREIDFIVS